MSAGGGLEGSGLASRLERLPGLGAVRAAVGASGVTSCWLVGGAVRDAALGITGKAVDLDLALPGDGEATARRLAQALAGSAFALDAEQGAWRVVAAQPATVDVIPLRAPGIEEDLAGRDFTVNAVAYDLLGGTGVLDPLGGLGDLKRRRVRLCAPGALAADPVRVLRAYRLAATLSLDLPAILVTSLGEGAAGLQQMARERIRDELFALLDSGRGAWALRAMARHGVLRHLFPGFEAWRDFDQGDYHCYDLAEHALSCAEAAEELAWAPKRFPFLEPSAPLVEHLARPLEAGVARRALLLLAAFLHDVAKPDTVQRDGGRLRFVGHEVRGGQQVYRLLRELRLGGLAARTGQRLVAAHLRLFQLAHQTPPTPRAQLRYLRDLRRELPEALLLSLADERATGPDSPAWPAVATTAGGLLRQHWSRQGRAPAKPLLRGRDLLAMGIPEGPRVGQLLAEVEAQERLGRVNNRAEALRLVRSLTEQPPQGTPGSGQRSAAPKE